MCPILSTILPQRSENTAVLIHPDQQLWTKEIGWDMRQDELRQYTIHRKLTIALGIRLLKPFIVVSWTVRFYKLQLWNCVFIKLHNTYIPCSLQVSKHTSKALWDDGQEKLAGKFSSLLIFNLQLLQQYSPFYLGQSSTCIAVASFTGFCFQNFLK